MKINLLAFLIILMLPIFTNCKKDPGSQDNLTIQDLDGNIYNTIQIGDQVWMSENLRTTHYANGTEIVCIADENAWGSLSITDKAMCYYANSITNGESYGALYTWAAAMNGEVSSENNPSKVQGVCPDGWHLPSDNEWKELEMNLGMSQSEADSYQFRGTNQGSKLAGNESHWNDGVLTADVEFGSSGFMALPAGWRASENGGFYQLHELATFWSSTASFTTLTISRSLLPHWTQVHRFTSSKKDGYSVRCLKD